MIRTIYRIAKIIMAVAALCAVGYLIFGLGAFERLAYLCLVGATCLAAIHGAFLSFADQGKIIQAIFPFAGAVFCSFRGWNPDLLMAADVSAIFYTLGLIGLAVFGFWPNEKIIKLEMQN